MRWHFDSSFERMHSKKAICEEAASNTKPEGYYYTRPNPIALEPNFCSINPVAARNAKKAIPKVVAMPHQGFVGIARKITITTTMLMLRGGGNLHKRGTRILDVGCCIGVFGILSQSSHICDVLKAAGFVADLHVSQRTRNTEPVANSIAVNCPVVFHCDVAAKPITWMFVLNIHNTETDPLVANPGNDPPRKIQPIFWGWSLKRVDITKPPYREIFASIGHHNNILETSHADSQCGKPYEVTTANKDYHPPCR
ncbi:hypothetical protein BDD12DRAFT_810722 [Trichophaea hybrida]|nr:hypothetical protein BDD12DRAFT_810722 [Trichophaea hybrida]